MNMNMLSSLGHSYLKGSYMIWLDAFWWECDIFLIPFLALSSYPTSCKVHSNTFQFGMINMDGQEASRSGCLVYSRLLFYFIDLRSGS